jgi:uncharacterized protein YebE (UPF0316 family)
MALLAHSALIFIARAMNVSLGTVRSVLALRRQKHLAAVLGLLESLIFILVISRVLQDTRNIANIVGYCGGFGAGTLMGLVIEEKLGLGHALVQATTLDDGRKIADTLRNAGYGVTEMTGQGQFGTVHIVTTVVPRRTAGLRRQTAAACAHWLCRAHRVRLRVAARGLDGVP